jgi:hypothetical protein
MWFPVLPKGGPNECSRCQWPFVASSCFAPIRGTLQPASTTTSWHLRRPAPAAFRTGQVPMARGRRGPAFSQRPPLDAADGARCKRLVACGPRSPGRPRRGRGVLHCKTTDARGLGSTVCPRDRGDPMTFAPHEMASRLWIPVVARMAGALNLGGMCHWRQCGRGCAVKTARRSST